ncbi:hypothetical protein BHE90_013543 [Fusarium euwallaceae]|uniref:Zn(2)-C6 fungal-type domain-containing protein n=2 Tax=Fusarium solani species complex TaxID=232080 RepID=A0A3M2RRR5_9HYPO|nr:hypothetical protein CDV36_012445 [Fusarium kuroshium]RTE72049.1 hypothetical protein BHE90_013543 [Fusarium euwallaceae]
MPSTLTTTANDNSPRPSSQKRPRFTRASRACEECRRRRVKCDSTKPRCSTCSHFDRRCETRPPSRKRGLPTGYVRAIECLLGQMMQSSDHGRDVALGILHQEVVSSAEATLVADSSSPGEMWRQSPAFRHLESILETADESRLGLEDDSRNGKKSAQLALSTACDDTARSKGGRAWSHPDALFGDPRSTRSGLVAQIQNLPENWLSLVDLYMSSTGVCFPIIPERDLVRLAQQMCSDRVPRREDGDASGDHAALLAVLAYASYQHELRYPSDLGHTLKPAVRLQLEAEAMAMDPNRCHDLGHAQALAVLALLEMSSGSLEKAWELLGEATSTVSALGLVGRTTRDPVLDSRSNLMLHGLFALETMVAFRLARIIKRIKYIPPPGSSPLHPKQPSPRLERLLNSRQGSAKRAAHLVRSSTTRLPTNLNITNLPVKLNDADRISQPVPMRHERVSDATGLIPGLRTLYRRRRSAAVPCDVLFAAGSPG